MFKFSAGYCYSNLNFTINNLEFATKREVKYRDEVYILKNILMRGSPSMLSLYLQEKLGAIHQDYEQYFQDINFSDQHHSQQNHPSYLQHSKLDDYLVHKRLLPMAIMRMQILILQLMLANKLSLDDDIKLYIACSEQWTDDIYFKHNAELKDYARLAFEDVFIFLNKLHLLRYKKELNKPKFKANYVSDLAKVKAKDGIKVDLKLCANVDENEKLSADVIYIRNDYHHRIEANYFTASISKPIKYEVNADDQEILVFFLQNIFGKKDFKPGQFDIICNVLNMRDTIGLLPTGAGKSLCYQLPCYLQPALSFVVSPIKSLMYDQVANLNKDLIGNIAVISSDQTNTEKDNILKDYREGRYLFIIISPERFQIKKFRESVGHICKNVGTAYAVIDEVHCLSEWGHDFRTSYLNLVKTIDNLSKYSENSASNITFIGLTATASVNVLKDIKAEFLGHGRTLLDRDIKTLSNYTRSELYFAIKKDCGDKQHILFNIIDHLNEENDFLQKKNKAIIIFTPYVNGKYGCHFVAKLLASRYGSENVAWYSGSKPKSFEPRQELGSLFNKNIYDPDHSKAFDYYKQLVQMRFKRNEFPIMVATKAFGMGIDKDNVFYTIHYGIPSSVESLYQEAGRAGRWDKSIESNQDLEALCYVLCSSESLSKHDYEFIFDKNARVADIKSLLEFQGYNTGDVLRQFFLSTQNAQDIQEEFNDTLKTLDYIARQQRSPHERVLTLMYNDVQNELKIRPANLEKIIYRLSLSGVIADWSNDFVESFEIRLGSSQSSDVIAALAKYIHKYDNLIDVEQELSLIAEKEHLSSTHAALLYLSTWIYENISYSRRQSLKTLCDWCDEYTDNESFKRRIESYFTFNDVSIILQSMADDQNKVLSFIEIVNVYNLPMKGDIENLIDKLSRFLESYRNNIGLDLLSGILRLINDDYDNIDGRARLESALHNMQAKLSSDICAQVLNDLIALNKNLANNEQTRNQALELFITLYNNFPDHFEHMLATTQLDELKYLDCVANQDRVDSINRKLYEFFEGF